MTGGPDSVYGVMYDEATDGYIDFEVDEEGLSFDAMLDWLDPGQTRQLYEALKVYYEEVVVQ